MPRGQAARNPQKIFFGVALAVVEKEWKVIRVDIQQNHCFSGLVPAGGQGEASLLRDPSSKASHQAWTLVILG